MDHGYIDRDNVQSTSLLDLSGDILVSICSFLPFENIKSEWSLINRQCRDITSKPECYQYDQIHASNIHALANAGKITSLVIDTNANNMDNIEFKHLNSLTIGYHHRSDKIITLIEKSIQNGNNAIENITLGATNVQSFPLYMSNRLMDALLPGNHTFRKIDFENADLMILHSDINKLDKFLEIIVPKSPETNEFNERRYIDITNEDRKNKLQCTIDHYEKVLAEQIDEKYDNLRNNYNDNSTNFGIEDAKLGYLASLKSCIEYLSFNNFDLNAYGANRDGDPNYDIFNHNVRKLLTKKRLDYGLQNLKALNIQNIDVALGSIVWIILKHTNKQLISLHSDLTLKEQVYDLHDEFADDMTFENLQQLCVWDDILIQYLSENINNNIKSNLKHLKWDVRRVGFYISGHIDSILSNNVSLLINNGLQSLHLVNIPSVDPFQSQRQQLANKKGSISQYFNIIKDMFDDYIDRKKLKSYNNRSFTLKLEFILNNGDRDWQSMIDNESLINLFDTLQKYFTFVMFGVKIWCKFNYGNNNIQGLKKLLSDLKRYLQSKHSSISMEYGTMSDLRDEQADGQRCALFSTIFKTKNSIDNKGCDLDQPYTHPQFVYQCRNCETTPWLQL